MSNPRKNFRRIPPQLQKKAERLEANEVVAACVRRVSLDNVAKGALSHLGVNWTHGDRLTVRDAILPPAAQGKYSRINVEGLEIVHKDLPKVTRAFTVEVPNYGDWSNGSHDVTRYREVYHRSFVPPRMNEIRVDVVAEEPSPPRGWAFRFRVNEPLDKSRDDYEERLLFNLNLLQENVEVADVFSADAALPDYLRSIYHTVGWELLPPGEREKTVQTIIAKMRNVSPEIKERLVARYDLLAGMGPQDFVHGTGGFDRYFGAKFADNLVVFENLEYGNAVYVMFENWEALSQRSRTELLESFAGQFARVIHREGWEAQLKTIVSDGLNGEANGLF
jgi:hypothetical protein